jgi:hypothetical protein
MNEFVYKRAKLFGGEAPENVLKILPQGAKLTTKEVQTLAGRGHRKI